jgi:hypothetical protein
MALHLLWRKFDDRALLDFHGDRMTNFFQRRVRINALLRSIGETGMS